ncbi:unnamed protein product, partial [Vitis vinifera]
MFFSPFFLWHLTLSFLDQCFLILCLIFFPLNELAIPLNKSDGIDMTPVNELAILLIELFVCLLFNLLTRNMYY